MPASCDLIVSPLSSLQRMTAFPAQDLQLEILEPIPRLLLVKVVFVSQHFIPSDGPTVDLLQFRYQPVKMFGFEHVYKLAESMQAIRLTRVSDQAMHNESVSDNLIPQPNAIDIALEGVVNLAIH